MKKGIYYGLVAALVLTFGISAFYLGSYLLEGKKQEDRFDELAAIVESQQAAAAVDQTTATAATESAEIVETANVDTGVTITRVAEGEMQPGYKALYEQNPDFAGWLKIDGTGIDYPVMQTSTANANYYLYRNFDKQDSTRGSLYAKEECDLMKPSDNITIFGHNMKDGSMFGNLGVYADKAKWEENSLIFFDTPYEFHVYKIFAVFKTTAVEGEGFRYHAVVDTNEQEFKDFVSTCKRMSFYDTGVTPVYGDKIICLSTCEYTLENGRFVVAAVRIS